MAKISYNPAQGYSEQLFAPLHDGRFIQLLEGNLNYPDEAAAKLLKSPNPTVQAMIKNGTIGIYIDSQDPQLFDMASGGAPYGHTSGNGIQMAPLTPIDVGLHVLDNRGQEMMAQQQKAGPPTYGMNTAPNGSLFGAQGILLSNGRGTYTPNGETVIRPTDPLPVVTQDPINDLNPTRTPDMPTTVNSVAPEVEGVPLNTNFTPTPPPEMPANIDNVDVPESLLQESEPPPAAQKRTPRGRRKAST